MTIPTNKLAKIAEIKDEYELLFALHLLLMVFLPIMLARWVFPAFLNQHGMLSVTKNTVVSALTSFVIVKLAIAISVAMVLISHFEHDHSLFWPAALAILSGLDVSVVIIAAFSLACAYSGAMAARNAEFAKGNTQ